MITMMIVFWCVLANAAYTIFGEIFTYHILVFITIIVLADVVLGFLLLLFDLDLLLHLDGELDLGVSALFRQFDDCCVDDCDVFIFVLAAIVFWF